MLTLRALNRATLNRQLLLRRDAMPPLAAIERLAGLQAQWPRPPFVGLWTRLESFARDALAELLAERRAVRGTLMRGTIHLVSAADYLAWRAPLQPMLTRGLRVLGDRAAGLDLEAVAAAAHQFLSAGPQTFEAIRDHLKARFPGANDRVLGYTARMLLPLVQEPTAATWSYPAVARFALAEAWLGRPPVESTGLDDLLLRYLAAFGPASVADAQTWSGLQGLKPAFEALRPRLAVFRDERGRELFDLPDAPRPNADVTVPVRFLPEFDNLLLAHADRRRVIADAHKPAVFLPGLRVAATLLVDGTVAGTWSIERQRAAASLVVTPFAQLAQNTAAALLGEAERLARFVEDDAGLLDVRLAPARGLR